MDNNKYILVGWPEIQNFLNPSIDKGRIFIGTNIGEPTDYVVSTWFVPEDLYNEVCKK